MANTTVIIDVEINEIDTMTKLQNLVKVIQDNKNETAQLEDANKSLSDNYKANAEQIAQNTAKISENKRELKMLQAEQKTAVQTLNTLNKDTLSYGSSLNEQRAAIGNLKQQYAALSEEQRQSTGGKEMLKTLAELNSKVLETEKSFGVYTRQVGNYEVGNKTLKTTLKELKNEMDVLAQAGGKNSEEYRQLAQEAGEVKRQINNLNAEIDASAKSATNIGALSGAMQGVNTSMMLFQNTLNSLNIDNERAAELMQKLQIAMVALSTVQQVNIMLNQKSLVFQASKNLLDKIGLSQTVAQTKAEAAKATVMGTGTVATKLAAAATWLLNAALSANPAILILTALIALTAGIAMLIGSSKEAKSAQADYNEELRENIRIMERQKKAQDEVFEAQQREIDRMKARGEATKDIQKAEQELADARLAAAKQRESEHENEVKNLKNNELLLQKAQDKERALEKEREDAGRRRRKKIDKELKELKEQIEGFEAQVQIGVEITTEVKTAEQKLQDIADSAVKAQKDAGKKASDERAKRIKETLDAARNLEDELLKLRKAGEERDIEAEKVATRRKIEDLQKRLDKEKTLTKEARASIQATIEAMQKGSEQRIIDIKVKYSEEAFQKQVTQEQKRIQMLLEVAAKGSAAERELRLKMIELLRTEELKEYQKTLDERLKGVKAGSAEEMAIWNNSVIELNALMRKFAMQEAEVEKQEFQKRVADQTLAIQNAYEERLLLFYDNEVQTALIEQEAAQQRSDFLVNLKQEEIAKLFESEAAYKAAVLAAQREIMDGEKKVAQTMRQTAQQQLAAVGSIAGAMKDMISTLAEDNESMAGFTKALALFQIGANLAIGISEAIAAGAGQMFPMNLVAIATGVGAVVAAIVGAYNVLKEPPKSPKFAGGGIVQGNSYSDQINARLSTGEIVMNKGQQKDLWNAIDSGNFGRGIDYEMLGDVFKEAASEITLLMDYREFTEFEQGIDLMEKHITI